MSQALRANVDINIVYKKNWDKYFLKFSIRYRLRYLVYLKAKTSKGRTIRKVRGRGVGNFQLARFFFFAHCLCRNFFFQVNPSARIFFFRQILLFFEQWNLDSLSMFLCFINYSTLTTDQRIQATLMQNLFENVHTVREEEATWSGRLPCAFFQSLPSGIPLPQPIIMMPYSIHQWKP